VEGDLLGMKTKVVGAAIILNSNDSFGLNTNTTLTPYHLNFSGKANGSAQIDISSINKWNEVSTTVQSNSANWANETISSYTTATIEGTNAINSLNGKPLISWRTQSAQEAGIADKARYDFNGNNLADDHNSLTALNNVVQTYSAQWAEGGSGDEEVNSFVYNNSATINEVNTSYQTNSGTYLTAHQAISAEEWNDCYDNVNTNSGAWGGSALPISAGNGVKISLQNDTLVFESDETVLVDNGNTAYNASFTLNEPLSSFERFRIYGCALSDGKTFISCMEQEPVTGSYISYNGTYMIQNGYPVKYMLGYSSDNDLTYTILQSRREWTTPDGTAWACNYNPTTDAEKPKNGFIYKVVGINRIAGGN
jgi:hypothetical protein